MLAHLIKIGLLLSLLTPPPHGLKKVVLIGEKERGVLFYYGREGSLSINGPADVFLTFRTRIIKRRSAPKKVVLYIDKRKRVIAIPSLPLSSWRIKGRKVKVSKLHIVKLKLKEGTHHVKIELPRGTYVRFVIKRHKERPVSEVKLNSEKKISLDAEMALGAVYDTLLSSSHFYTGVCGDVKGEVLAPMSLSFTSCFDFYRQGYLFWNSLPLPGHGEISMVTEKRLFIEGLVEIIARISKTYEFFFPIGYAYFRFWSGTFNNEFQGPTGGIGFRIRKNIHLIEINPAKFSVSVGGNETSALSGNIRFSISYSLIYKRKFTSISLFVGLGGESMFYEGGERHYEKISVGFSL